MTFFAWDEHNCLAFYDFLCFICADVWNKILPGITHWQSPKFFGYYPFNVSTAGILGEILSGGVNVAGFNWIMSPVVTELEIIVLDWLGKLLHLPEEFLSSGNATYTICILHWIPMSYNCTQYLQIFFIFLLLFVGLWGRYSSQFCAYFPLRALKSWIAGKGGGIIQGTSSEAVLVVMLAARKCVVKKVCTSQHMSEAEALSKLVVYTSDQAQSCVLRACQVLNLLHRGLKCLLPHFCTTTVSCYYSMLGAWFLA